MEQGINAYQNQDQWDKMYNLKRGLAVASMPWESALGFALGSYIKDYIDRGNENKITNASKEPQTDFLKGLTPENLSNYSIDSTNAITSGGDLNLNNNLEYKGNAITSDNIADKTTENNISNNTSPVAQTVSLLGAVSNLKPKGEIISSSNLPNYGDLSSRQNQQQQMVQNAINEENQKQQNEMNLIMKFLPMSFNNAVASSNEVAANSLPEYLKPRIDYYVNIINSAKADYMKAQANNDTEGMQSANAQANAAREELNKLGVDSSYFGADKTQEQSQKSMADLNYYKEPIPQKISSYQQNLANSIERQLIQAKYMYDNASTDDERFLAQVQAKNARDLARQYGLDVSSFDSDISLDRAKLAYLNETPQFNNTNTSTPNYLTTQEYWQQLYEEARARGVGRTAAERYAKQKSAAYQSRKMSALSDQFISYGTNPDGSVNNLGMSMLAQLRLEDPDAFTQLLSAYGMPKDQYAFGLQLARDAVSAQNQLTAMDKQAKYNEELQQKRYDLEDRNDIEKNKRQDASYAYRAGIDTNNQKDLISYKANIEKQNNSNNNNLSKEEQKMFGEINSLVFNLLSSAKNDDALSSEDTLNKYQQELAKYGPYLTEDEYQFFSNSIIYVFNFLREKKAGNEDNARKYWNAIPDEIRKEYLPEYSD